MAVGSMTCVQIGLALSVPLFGQLGPLGTVWLRLAWASLILLVAGACWAAYILLTQAVGDEVAGLEGLAVSIPVAALVSTPFAAPEIGKALTPHLLLAGLGLALLLPVIPFGLEMYALRRLTTA